MSGVDFGFIGSDITWPIPSATGASLGPAVVINSVQTYKWLVVVGGILAFAMAWGIGANDVANAFATSVGAGSLSLKWACVIAAVMEFLGAILMGGNVTDTVRKKIINTDIFDPNSSEAASNGPEILMVGFLVALATAALWLLIATYFGLPVSTTHSIIGSLIGVGLGYRGFRSVVWISEGAFFDKLKGVVGVIISWVISPVLSGVFAVIIFLIVRHTVLRRKNPVKNGFIFLPLFYAATVAITLFFIIYKGSARVKLDKRFSVGEAIGVAVGGGVGVALLAWWLVIPQAKRMIDNWEAREIEKLSQPDEIMKDVETGKKFTGALKKVGINVEVEEDLDQDTIAMHENVEKFDPKVEQLFTWLQIFTAAFDAFSHGANDVANAIAPFASIFQLFNNNGVISSRKTSKFESDGQYTGGGGFGGLSFSKGDLIPDHKSFCGNAEGQNFYRCADEAQFPFTTPQANGAESSVFDVYDKNGALVEGSSPATCYTECNPRNDAAYGSSKQEVPLWILAMGGAGIVLGLAMWGYRIIIAIGLKLTKLTPSRGFCIELGAAITVIIASRIGIPVSTTHCQVGATMGVGLVELKSNTVNWKQFLFICIGWVFTVLLTALTAAGLFAFMTLTPYKYASPEHLSFCPANRVFIYDQSQNQFRGVACSGITDRLS